ncbi:MAG: thioredoxin family protein [Phycisphaerales bacterium]|nr:thioredoxin family protein [Phycisphaerales bacterium]
MGKFLALVVVVGLLIGGWYVFGQNKRAAAGAGGLPPVFSSMTFAEAVAENKTSGKPLIVNFSASWCPPCQTMKKEVWPTAQVENWVAANAKAIYVDVDQDGAAAQQMGIRGIPTIVIFKNGQKVTQGGFKDAGELVAWFEKNK